MSAMLLDLDWCVKEWPHGRIILTIPRRTAVLTPNTARRLRAALDEFIELAEEKSSEKVRGKRGQPRVISDGKTARTLA